MIVIYTGIEEIDKEIQMNLRDSIVAHYSDYLIENNTFEGQTVIISPQAVEGLSLIHISEPTRPY